MLRKLANIIALPFIYLLYIGVKYTNIGLNKFVKHVPDKHKDVKTGLHIKRALHASLRAACCKCGAPPAYVNHYSIKEGWPGCYVEADDPRRDQLVGDTCPNCGEPVPQATPLGKLWEASL